MLLMMGSLANSSNFRSPLSWTLNPGQLEQQTIRANVMEADDYVYIVLFPIFFIIVLKICHNSISFKLYIAKIKTFRIILFTRRRCI